MPATLVSLSDGPHIRIDRPIMVIGRSPDCDVVVDSTKVSRQHCCLAQVNNYVVARDLGSTNGIRVNGKRIEESKLQEGDEFSIANIPYRLTWQAVEDALELPPGESGDLDLTTQISDTHSGSLPTDDDDAKLPRTLLAEELAKLRQQNQG